MRHRARLLTAALACTLSLVGCGDRAGDGAAGDDTGPRTTTPAAGDDTEAVEPAAAAIPDDFPLSAGMGGPQDTIPTSRTGTGLRDLTICGTSPLRGVDTRDRMVADNSGGESANTRELLLLGSPEDAVALAESFEDLVNGCDEPDVNGEAETLTEVRRSPFGRGAATTLLQTYTVDGRPGDGATVVHVVPAGAAVLVTSTYGQWASKDVDEAVPATVEPLGDTVDALTLFEARTSPAADGPESSAVEATRVGSARPTAQTYGEGSLASLGEQGDGVTETTGKIVPAMCVFTKTGC